MELQTISVSDIVKDSRTQPRATIDEYTVNEYRQDMMLGDEFPPLMVFYDGDNYYLSDGWHRLEAAIQCQTQEIQCAVKNGSIRDAILYSCSANADHGKRRTNGDKSRAVKKLLQDEEWTRWSDREIARRCKVDPKTVKTYRNKPHYGNSAVRKYTTKHGTVATMDTTNIGGNGSQREAEQEQPAFEIEPGEIEEVKTADLNYQLIVSPIDELVNHIEPGTIDAIITDPPYPKEYIQLFEELAIAAKVLLKEGGILVTLCGQYYIKDYLNLITRHLDYLWLGNYYMPNGPYYYDNRKLVHNKWKPVIICSKGKWNKKQFSDTYINERQDKNHHEWGQGLQGFTDLVNNFTQPNDTVLDPFVGGGTTAIAALHLGRYFIGSDIEQAEVEKAGRRLQDDSKEERWK